MPQITSQKLRQLAVTAKKEVLWYWPQNFGAESLKRERQLFGVLTFVKKSPRPPLPNRLTDDMFIVVLRLKYYKYGNIRFNVHQ